MFADADEIPRPQGGRGACHAVPGCLEEQPRAVYRAVVVELDGLLVGLEGFDGPVGGLLVDRVVEPGGRVVGVRLLGNVVLAVDEVGALLLEVGLAEVAAHEGLAGVEADRGLELAAALRQGTVADPREAQAQPR